MKARILLTAAVSLIVLMLGITLGSVSVPLTDVFRVIASGISGGAMGIDGIRETTAAIIWNTRFPRALLAFAAGGALSVSGAVIQSVMRNPLASPYTLGVSSGASFGACLVILYGASLPLPSAAALPVTGFAFGLLTIFLTLGAASRLDGQMRNNTIILVGMVFALFINAVTTLLSYLNRESLQRLLVWQMGSFSMKDWPATLILMPAAVLGAVFCLSRHKELDIMTFGENQAAAMGVGVKGVKIALLTAAAALTGAAISFCGVIGFIDLAAPHITRKIFGASHKYVIPMSAVIGGAFMTACDLLSRTASPSSASELPVGAVTAILGAPFFAFVYFSGRKKHAGA